MSQIYLKLDFFGYFKDTVRVLLLNHFLDHRYSNHCWDTCCLKLALQSKIFQIGLLSFLADKKGGSNNGQM